MTEAANDNVLLLVWKHPVQRARFLIGRLWQEDAKYHFRYERGTSRSLNEALRAGFRLLDSFPDPNGEWASEELFPVFRRRLPPAWRESDFQALGITKNQSLDYLRLTGGRLVTDTFEFLEPIRIGEDQEYRLRFPIAGWRYYRGETVIHQMAEGHPLTLRLEPTNPSDPNAIQVLWSEVLLGYVPAVYSWYLDDIVAADAYQAAIAAIGSQEDPQIRVIADFTGQVLDGGLSYRHMPPGVEQYATTLQYR